LTTIAQTNFYFLDSYHNLYEYDLQDCSQNFITKLLDSNGVDHILTDMAITDNGEFYFISGDEVYHYDQEEDYIIEIGSIYLSCDPQLSNAYYNSCTSVGNELLIIGAGNGSILKFDLNNNSATCIGMLTSGNDDLSGGIVEHEGYFYASGRSPAGLYKFKINQTYTALEEISFIPMSDYIQGYSLLSLQMDSTNEDKSLITSHKPVNISSINFSQISLSNSSISTICIVSNFQNVYGAASKKPTDPSVEPLTEVICEELILPNIFSPNGDGINDKFRAIQGDSLSEINLKIYNRYGMEVYSQTEGPIEWDGKQSASNASESSSYYYVLKYRDYCDEELVKKGSLMLIY
tara:strand:+ start:797 stop:1843 length:1047 start_codon:yes stop_codon:yes gene_type:complete